MKTQEREPERRDSLGLVLLILLLGFVCIIITSGWALRFAPNWRLIANMGSNLDPDAGYLTNQPVNFFEPLDPAILTNPPWFNIFLTPGAILNTRTPQPQPTSTVVIIASVTQSTPIPSPTASPTTIFIPANTPTRTATPIPGAPTFTPTRTPTNTPVPQVDLLITKDDGVTTYAAGSTITYTIVVTNNGPSDVVGATVSDPKPTQVTTWGWCLAPCAPVATSNTTLGATINLASGASATYVVLANIDPSAIGDLINTVSVAAPMGYNETAPGNNSATDTDVLQIMDLAITKTDGVSEYSPGGFVNYTITVTNIGNVDLTGVSFVDFKPPQITEWLWSCNKAIALCSSTYSTTDFAGVFDLVVGDSITFTAASNVNTAATGNLVNTATAVLGSLSWSATDTDVFNAVEPELGPPDGGYIVISGSYIMDVGAGNAFNYTGASDPAWDFVYFERWFLDTFTGTPMVQLDCIEVQVGQSATGPWYTVLYWCDGIADTNSNIDINVIGGAETDNRIFPPPPLYTHPSRPDLPTGVAIDIDAPLSLLGAPIGSYQYIQFIQPPMGGVDPPEIDSVLILP